MLSSLFCNTEPVDIAIIICWHRVAVNQNRKRSTSGRHYYVMSSVAHLQVNNPMHFCTSMGLFILPNSIVDVSAMEIVQNTVRPYLS